MKKFLALFGTAILVTSCFNTGYVKEDGQWRFQYYESQNLQYKYVVIKAADKKSFKKLKNDFAKDKNHVYLKGIIMKDVDPNTFEIINKDNSKDKNHVYIGDYAIPNADPKTFVHLEGEISKDKNHIFVASQEIAYMDVNTFSIIKYPFSKDKNHIYNGSVPMDVKDKASFKVTNPGSGQSYTDGDMLISITPELNWLKNQSHPAGFFYVSDATAETKDQKFVGYQEVK